MGAQSLAVTNGAEEFSIKHAWATDYHPDTCETYRRNICPDDPRSVVCHDILTLDYDRLSEISAIDGLAFGFPCNDFSIVGEQKGINGTFGPLYSYGVKALKRFQPMWFVAENVGGLRNSNEGGALKTILRELEGAGYNLFPHLYKFEEYGIPQARHRFIIVGIRKDIDVTFKIPAPTYEMRTAKQALCDPPIPPGASNHEYTAQSKSVVERLKHIKPGQNAFTATMPDELRLKVKAVRISQIYKRLDPQKPSYTITGSGGGGTHVYHWSENRALTNRERARIQTFPDDFEFYGSKESVRRQIGMAVPPMGARVIFKALLNSFAGISYPSVAVAKPHVATLPRLMKAPINQLSLATV